MAKKKMIDGTGENFKVTGFTNLDGRYRIEKRNYNVWDLWRYDSILMRFRRVENLRKDSTLYQFIEALRHYSKNGEWHWIDCRSARATTNDEVYT